MKKVLPILFLFITVMLYSQKQIEATNAVTVTGAIEKEMVITMSDIENAASVSLEDLVITNHMGEAKKTLTNIEGVPLIQLLKDIALQTDSPKYYSTFYFIFEAIDGYKVVYSWNELFNSPIGKQVFIVTKKDGTSLQEMEDRILVISPSDIRTGRRHIKALSKIIVKKID